MRKGGPCRIAGRLRCAFLASSILAAILAPGSAAAAALITGIYQLDFNQDVTTKGAERKDVRKLKQQLELKYRGFLSPVVENQFSFKIQQEIVSDAPDTTQLLPVLDLGFKGKYWNVRAGAKRTHENSDDPGKNPKITDAWFVEFFYQAPRRVPDLKAKYTLDTEFQDGATDTRKQGVALSTLYAPNYWLDVRGDYTKDLMDDRRNPDTDTLSEKSTGSVILRRLISSKLRAEAQYTVELTRNVTLLDTGGASDLTKDQSHTLKSKVSFRPFRSTSLDGSYDYDLKQNMVLGEHTLTTNIKATADQKVGEPLTIRGEFLRVITESRHTVDDSTKTEDTWTVDLKARFSKQLDFTVRRQEKHTVEDHVDTAKNATTGTISDTASWSAELAPFWKASISHDRTDTLTWDTVARQEVKTAIDTKYGLKSTFDFKAIKLTLDPSYDLTFKDDRAKPEKSETRNFKFKIAYTVLSTRSIEAKVDHTYERKVDTAARNLQRTDNSNGNLTWKDPFPGWMFGIDLTRTATDTSEDDLPPDISSSFGFKFDYKYRWLAMNASYKYDMKSLTDNGETVNAKVGYTAPRWDVSLTYNLTKLFAAETDEKYSITLAFKYNL